MLYTLNRNVYFVNGKSRGCIYDFNKNKLYSINEMLSSKIQKLSEEGICINKVNDFGLKNVLDEMVGLEILIISEDVNRNDIQEIKKSNSTIEFAWIEITTRCNLRCIHCYNESEENCKLEMDYDDYTGLIDYLQRMSVDKVQIIGGEPFFNKRLLKKALDYTVGKFKVIEIFTNGTLITEEWLKYLAENQISIALSVYSYDEQEHDYVTKVKGSWQKTNYVIDKLREYNIKYRVCNVLMAGVSVGEKRNDLYCLSEEKDVVRMSGRASFKLLSDDLIRKKLITKESFKAPLSKAFSGRLLNGHNCFKNKIYVAADMSVYPCVMERRLKHGVIEKNKEFALSDVIRNFNKEVVEECNVCEYRYACFDCRPNSLSGNINEKPWYCTYNPIDGKWNDVETFVCELKTRWEAL